MSGSLTLQHIIENRDALVGDLDRRQAIVRDYVRGVARHYATGLYLFGRPGTAKTHTVRKVLSEDVREIFSYERGHLTPMGLFDLIADHPDEVIVLDDLGAVLKSDVALQILLSALEHPSSGRSCADREIPPPGGTPACRVSRRDRVHLQPRAPRRRVARGLQEPRPYAELRPHRRPARGPDARRGGARLARVAAGHAARGRDRRRPLPDRRDAPSRLPVRPAPAVQQGVPRLSAVERRRGGVRLGATSSPPPSRST